MMDKTGRILIKAAELIAQRGWCQNSAEQGPRICAGRATIIASGGDHHAYKAMARVNSMLVDYANGFVYAYIAAFNDTPGRTAEEVIDALIAAAYWND